MGHKIENRTEISFTNMAAQKVAGDHTRTVNISTPTVGGLMKFTVKTATCMGCKTPLPKGGKYSMSCLMLKVL
jgi:hypothetical protein